jgi:hypothetical protein
MQIQLERRVAGGRMGNTTIYLLYLPSQQSIQSYKHQSKSNSKCGNDVDVDKNNTVPPEKERDGVE